MSRRVEGPGRGRLGGPGTHCPLALQPVSLRVATLRCSQQEHLLGPQD